MLVGEDNIDLRGRLTAAIETEGHDTAAAARGADLLDKLSVSLHPELGVLGFDLVISEAAMLGSQELQRLRRLGDWANVPPFILIAGPEDEEVRTQAEELGAIATIMKPLDLDHLRRLVRTLLTAKAQKWGEVAADSRN